jgi:hypothetical protein
MLHPSDLRARRSHCGEPPRGRAKLRLDREARHPAVISVCGSGGVLPVSSVCPVVERAGMVIGLMLIALAVWMSLR